MGSYKMCLCFTRKFRWSEAEPPTDVRGAFGAYTEGGSHMTPDQLRRFLVEEQGETGVTLADAEKIVAQVRAQRHSTLVKLGKPLLTVEDFHHMLFSQDLNPPIRNEIHHDMTEPLSHYYIYTGHNSYLTGNQLSSDCSDVPIVKALQKGVRVIELDIWPNSNKDGVDVLHGRSVGPCIPSCIRGLTPLLHWNPCEGPASVTIADGSLKKLPLQMALLRRISRR